MSYFNNAIEPIGFNSMLKRIEEIERLSKSISGVTKNHSQSFSSMMSEINTQALRNKFSPFIETVAKENNIDPKLVKAVIERESGYNPNAVSKAGAMGLMQLMPETAKELGVKNPLNPTENIRAGTKYLSSLLNRYQGDVALALSAYNAGAGNVERFKGVPPFQETQQYVKGIMSQLS